MSPISAHRVARALWELRGCRGCRRELTCDLFHEQQERARARAGVVGREEPLADEVLEGGESWVRGWG